MESKLERRTILDLLGQEFIIPSYQRGYRWTDVQVKALLDHIWEFSQTDEKGFYCLQPLVVTKIGEDKWEVIDGQQRLTTIYIIIKYFLREHFESESLIKFYQKELFSITYETRSKSEEFLDSINFAEENNNTVIDFHYMQDAYNTIHTWAKKNLRNYNIHVDFIKMLLGGMDSKQSVQFILYEIPFDKDSDLSYDLFSRLNIGKISLTNAELVKALFLRKWDNVDKYFELRQIRIASEWDTIENQLQKADFWNFIYKDKFNYITRIEYIFDILKDSLDHDNKDREDRYTFNKYYEEVYDKSQTNKDELIDRLWGEIKITFQIFESWYNNVELYNLVGFIVNAGLEKIGVLINNYKTKNKDIFNEYLKGIIKNEYQDIGLDNLNYGSPKDNKKIQEYLLLLNLATLKNQQKFRFDQFNEEKWDIEHIHSQNPKENFKPNEQKQWLELFEEYYSNNMDLIQKIQECEKSLQNNSSADTLFKEIYDFAYDDLKIPDQDISGDDDKNNIGNLTLLDSQTNRSYKNTWFLFKRRIILQNDSQGKFIPIATKNIFTKVYSSAVTDLLSWSIDDQQNYKVKMKEIVNGFLGVQNG